MEVDKASRKSRLKRGTGRVAILDSTLRLIASRGVHGWTMRDVAEEAHCSLGSTTYHFCDRSQLLREALEAFADDEIRRFEAVMSSIEQVAGDSAATTTAVLREIDPSLIRPWTVVAQMEVYLAAARDPAIASLAENILDSYHQFVQRALILLGCPPAKAVMRAKLIVAVVDGMVLHHLARGSGGEISDELAAAVAAVAASPV
jgi:DNA-binding transcriptional regulator YbjK